MKCRNCGVLTSYAFCPPCLIKQKRSIVQMAREGKSELPLVGSIKQIRWAEQIRAKIARQKEFYEYAVADSKNGEVSFVQAGTIRILETMDCIRDGSLCVYSDPEDMTNFANELFFLGKIIMLQPECGWWIGHKGSPYIEILCDVSKSFYSEIGEEFNCKRVDVFSEWI